MMDDEVDEAAIQAELERTWGVFLKKVNLTRSPGYTGSNANFGLPDIKSVLGVCKPKSLHDDEENEELTMFELVDHRFAAVWVAHCGKTCCGVCVHSLAGVVGPSPRDVVLGLPQKLRMYITNF
jgi:hypothetical protein